MSEISFSNNSNIKALVDLSRSLNYLTATMSLLEWDQEVLMPLKASKTRAKQVAQISEVHHKMLIDPANGKLLDTLESEISEGTAIFTDADKALVREFRRDYDRAIKLPGEFVKEETEHNALSLEAWREARELADFEKFAPFLEKTISLARKKAAYLGYASEPYDALLDLFEPGLTAVHIASIFDPLKEFTKGFVKEIEGSSEVIDNSILHRSYLVNKQQSFCRDLAEGLGYDFEAGRLDKSTHPFTTEFGTVNDVRITTRYYDNEINTAITGTIHEVGHALYEQGVSGVLDSTHIGTGVSLGIHESQSRMWENFVGRSVEFWNHWFPQLVSNFEGTINLSEKEFFVNALNKVQPSYIRVEADEVTYNLHIILRFELERALLNGELEAADIPEAWNSKMEEYLGIRPANDAEGCLQDIHWAMGGLGYFPTYALGNIYAAQFWETIKKDIPDIYMHLSSGNTKVLLDWLREKLHVYGAVYSPATLCEQITGESLNPEYLKKYLSEKFGRIYKL